MSRSAVPAMLCAFIPLSSAVAAEGKQADELRAGVAAAPTIRASEDTPINYMGGTPSAFTGALDADDSTYNRLAAC